MSLSDEHKAAMIASGQAEQWNRAGIDPVAFHPAASHVSPDYRDGWNAALRAVREKGGEPGAADELDAGYWDGIRREGASSPVGPAEPTAPVVLPASDSTERENAYWNAGFTAGLEKGKQIGALAAPVGPETDAPYRTVTVAGLAMASGRKMLGIMQAVEAAGEGSVTANQQLDTDQILQAVAYLASPPVLGTPPTYVWDRRDDSLTPVQPAPKDLG